MLMYNLLEYSDNFTMPPGSLWNYNRDEINDDANENVNNRINNNKTITSKSFEYKAKLIESMPNDNNTLDFPEISIVLAVPGNPDANPPVPGVGAIQTTSETFQINNAKLYRPVATLSIDDNIKFLEIIKQVFKRTISWNKFRYEITTQTKSQ